MLLGRALVVLTSVTSCSETINPTKVQEKSANRKRHEKEAGTHLPSKKALHSTDDTAETSLLDQR
jgi:hypothetical protein